MGSVIVRQLCKCFFQNTLVNIHTTISTEFSTICLSPWLVLACTHTWIELGTFLWGRECVCTWWWWGQNRSWNDNIDRNHFYCSKLWWWSVVVVPLYQSFTQKLKHQNLILCQDEGVLNLPRNNFQSSGSQFFLKHTHNCVSADLQLQNTQNFWQLILAQSRYCPLQEGFPYLAQSEIASWHVSIGGATRKWRRKTCYFHLVMVQVIPYVKQSREYLPV